MASLFRNSGWDGLLVILASAYGVALILRPSIVLIAFGVWWGLNTVAHNFIHLPFFKSRILNRCFSSYLSVLFGIPQRLWRDRHLAHHSGRKWHLRMSIQLTVESILVGLLWLLMIALASEFCWTTYLPGWLIGLALCQLHGYYEHARGTTSHYGKVYNVLFFNDGYHAEHHARPGEHWTRLHLHSQSAATTSRWPAFLRWLELVSLDSLEKLVLHSPCLQRFVLKVHERAFRAQFPIFKHARNVTIVGGGIFPRTALILQRLLPEAQITIVDCAAANLAAARRFLPTGIIYIHHLFDGRLPPGVELLVIPLSFKGSRESIYNSRPACGCTVLIHEWLWRHRGKGAVVSVLLLKRLIGVAP